MTVERLECPSRIERVVVYARGALVTRRVELPTAALPSGPCELVVRGLTALAEVGGARAVVDGTRAVVALRARLVLPEPTARPGELLEALTELDLASERLVDDRAAAQSRRDALAGVGLDLGLEGRARRIDPAARIADAAAVSGLLARELARLDARLRELDAALERNAREREALALRAAQSRTGALAGAALPTYELFVRLAAARAPGAPALHALAVEYAVGAARWWPAYTARFTDGGARVHWALEAFVAQASGEDWPEVALALSTADLVQDARLPELPSLRLGRAQPPARKGYRPPPRGLDAMWEGFDRAARLAPPTSGGFALPQGSATIEAEITGSVGAMTRTAATEVLAKKAGSRSLHPAELAVNAPLSASDAPYGGEGGAVDMTVALADGEFEADALDDGVLHEQAAVAHEYQKQDAREMAPPLARRRAGLFGGAAGSGMPAPQAPAAAPASFTQSAPRRALGATAAPGGSAGVRAIVPEAPRAIEPADAWLEFDALVMADADDRARRGHLVREPAPAAVGSRAEASRASIEALAAPALARDPRETRGQFDHRYDSRGRADVPSDVRAHRVTLAAAETGAQINFRTVPREAAEVYREAEITNPFDAPLLGGPVDVFIDGALTTTSAITAVDRGGTLYLGLGVEDRLRVARNARVDEGTAGLLGGSSVVDHTVTIELASSLGRAVKVDVVDRVPVTTEKDVDIAVTSQQPAFSVYDQAERGAPVRGGVRWRVEVPAGGKARVEFGYRVTLPARSEVVGGNRRE